MKMDSRKSSENITNTQAEGPKDQTVSPHKVIRVYFAVNIRKHQNRSYETLSHNGETLDMALQKLKAVRDEIKTHPDQEMLVCGRKGIKGYLNLRMPIMCFPENCEVEITFAHSQRKQTEENQEKNKEENQEVKQKENKEDNQEVKQEVKQEENQEVKQEENQEENQEKNQEENQEENREENQVKKCVVRHHKNASTDCVKFYIHAVGKTRKEIVKCGALHKEGNFLCVYAFKGETIKNALCEDGRFSSILKNDDWKLTEGPNSILESSQLVDNLEGKFFQVEFDRRVGTRAVAARNSKSKKNFCALKETTADKHLGLKKERDKIIKNFKKCMERGKGKKLFQLHKTNFGKLTKNSTLVKVHRLLCHCSESVGYLSWDNEGKKGSATCFVFREMYIFTCLHVIDEIVGEEMDTTKRENIISWCVRVTFVYEETKEEQNSFCIEPWFKIFDRNLDYVVLKLKTNGQQVPVGLYNKISESNPVPPRGLVYMIGHPDGEAKTTDACAVISHGQQEEEQENPQAGEAEGHGYDMQYIHMHTQKSFQEIVSNPEGVSDNTSFYFGSSGSPVFDLEGSLVAMLTAGFTYEYQKGTSSIVEFASTLKSILSHIKQNHGMWYETVSINP
uniref:Protein FAM111A n=1 Tax=Catagonus wagneri TaxID=51154 RepID=A0A8C3W1Y0_9CETA